MRTNDPMELSLQADKLARAGTRIVCLYSISGDEWGAYDEGSEIYDLCEALRSYYGQANEPEEVTNYFEMLARMAEDSE